MGSSVPGSCISCRPVSVPCHAVSGSGSIRTIIGVNRLFLRRRGHGLGPDHAGNVGLEGHRLLAGGVPPATGRSEAAASAVDAFLPATTSRCSGNRAGRGTGDSSWSRTTMRPPHFRQRMRAAFASFSSALSSRKRAPQSPHVMSINDKACSSGNGRPVLPSRLRGQRLDQARETDELDLRHIVAFSEASVHVMGDRVVFPYRFPRYASSCRTCSVTRTRVGPSFRHTSARADLEIRME